VKPCPSRDRLFAEYREGVKEWVASVNKIENPINGQRLMAAIENSRFRALTAKAQYKSHVVEHDCGSFTEAVPAKVRESSLRSLKSA
jgi:hypothetical protein